MGRRTWVADKGFQTKQTKIQLVARTYRLCQTWAIPNTSRIRLWARTGHSGADPGPGQTNPKPNSGLDQTTFILFRLAHTHLLFGYVWPMPEFWYVKSDPYPVPDQTDPVLCMGQIERSKNWVLARMSGPKTGMDQTDCANGSDDRGSILSSCPQSKSDCCYRNCV